MSIFYGPINSRRLGRSLGVDIIPPKICSYDCIYCYENATTQLTIERKEYLPFQEVFTELSELCGPPKYFQKHDIDYVTFAGSGEPTLNSALGEYIRFIKERTPYRVAVITNGSLLGDPQVRRDLLKADLVVPSLDAAEEETFSRINRPHQRVSMQLLFKGLQEFCAEFEGAVWLEVLLCKGINDSEAELESLARLVEFLPVNKVQINTIYYSTAEPFALPVSKQRMQRFKDMLSIPAEIFGGV